MIAQAAASFILEKADEEAPYFAYVPFNAPHGPFQAKAEDLERFAMAPSKTPPKKKFSQL